MIVSLHNSRQHMGHINHPLCKSESGCSGNDVITTILGSMATHRNQTLHIRVTDQTESAIIYVAVVVVFYAAIILLLLGTSSRRPMKPRSRSHQQTAARIQLQDPLKQPTVAVYIDDDDKTEVQVQANMEDEDDPKVIVPI